MARCYDKMVELIQLETPLSGMMSTNLGSAFVASHHSMKAELRSYLLYEEARLCAAKLVTVILRPGKTPDQARGSAGAAPCHQSHPRPLAIRSGSREASR